MYFILITALFAAQLAEYGGFKALWWVVGGLCFVTALAFRRLKD